MDSRPQDGPESGGWTRERRMGSRAQDGPESGGWTRERRMDSRGGDGLQPKCHNRYEKNDTTEPPDCSKFPKTWVLSYLTPTSPTRVQPAQSFQKKEQNQKKQIARQTPRSQAPCQIAGSTRERKMDPRAISGHERAGWTPERRMDPGAQDGPKRLMDSRPQDGPDRRIDSRVLAAFQTVSRSISPPFCKETHRIFSMHLISFQVLQQRPARNS